MPKKATTKDVIEPLPKPGRIPRKWRKHYERLLRLRASLLNARADLVKDALEEQPAFSLHMADAGTDNYDRDLALGMLSSEQNALYEIDQALIRIRNGSYGICEATGQRIKSERLNAIPWTRFSADAEKQLEKQGQASLAKIGPRTRITKTIPGSD